MNQLNNDMILDICAAAEAFEGNDGVGALVLTGSGEDAFAGERLLEACSVLVSVLLHGLCCICVRCWPPLGFLLLFEGVFYE